MDPIFDGLDAEATMKLLRALTWREREIVKLRNGIADKVTRAGEGYTYTQEEVGRIFRVTRDRIRSAEVKAHRKMRAAIDT